MTAPFKLCFIIIDLYKNQLKPKAKAVRDEEFH